MTSVNLAEIQTILSKNRAPNRGSVFLNPELSLGLGAVSKLQNRE